MRKDSGFTLLELIIVLALVALILGLSTVFFARALPSSKFDSAIRELSSTIKYARTLAQISGESQTVVIDLDSKKFGIEGRQNRSISSDVEIKIIDPFLRDVGSGKYRIVFQAAGGMESETIVLSRGKKSVNIEIDPVVGSMIIR
jgi:general secretion pathway protein H